MTERCPVPQYRDSLFSLGVSRGVHVPQVRASLCRWGQALALFKNSRHLGYRVSGAVCGSFKGRRARVLIGTPNLGNLPNIGRAVIGTPSLGTCQIWRRRCCCALSSALVDHCSLSARASSRTIFSLDKMKRSCSLIQRSHEGLGFRVIGFMLYRV